MPTDADTVPYPHAVTDSDSDADGRAADGLAHAVAFDNARAYRRLRLSRALRRLRALRKPDCIQRRYHGTNRPNNSIRHSSGGMNKEGVNDGHN